MAGAVQASEIINSEASDGYVSSTVDGAQGGGLTVNTTLNRARAGNWTGGTGQTHAGIFIFQLPDLGAVANPFDTVTFSFTTSAIDKNPAVTYSADLYGIDARSTSDMITSDFYVGDDEDPDATKLQDSIMTPTSTSGSFTSVDISDYLNAQYAAGMNAGDYVFLRVNRDGSTNITDEGNGYIVWASEAADAGDRPSMSYTTIQGTALIVWGTATTVFGGTDVSTRGDLEYAYNAGTTAKTLNGVTFLDGTGPTALGTNITLSGGALATHASVFWRDAAPLTDLSAEYENMMGSGVYLAATTPVTITLTNLTAGREYEVQYWANDSRATDRTLTLASGGNTVVLDLNSTDALGGVGQVVTGTFTADAVTQSFTAEGSISFLVSAIQVRDITVVTLRIDWIGGAGSADWNDTNSWSSIDLPGSVASGNVTFSGAEDGTTLAAPFTFTNASDIQVRAGAAVALNADLSGVDELTLGGEAGSDGGTISQSGGTVSAGSILIGSLAAATSESVYTLSGGSLDASGDLHVNNGTFALEGSAAAVSVDSLTITDLGELSFTLGEAGVSPLAVSHAFSVGDSTARLTVDVSAYTGTATMVELVQFSSLSGTFEPSSIVINGLTAEQGSARIVFDGDSLNLELGPLAYESELAAILALGNLTNAPALYDINNAPTTWAAVSAAAIASGEAQTIYYDGLGYEGHPTRIFAWVGLPADLSSPVPAMVLAHGGGGTAFKEWVDLWTARGYAAIAMDLEGRVSNEIGKKQFDVNLYPGPTRDGIYQSSVIYPSRALPNHWMYHGVADCVLANSLMRSAPEVNADQVGMMGISWGGVITSTTIGIDTRFMFAIPTYGCGHLYDDYNQYADNLADCEFYKQVWDPMMRIHRATMPTMWFSWPQDQHFALDCQAATYLSAPGERMVSLIPYLGHGHKVAYNPGDSYAFADGIISNGTPWCSQQSQALSSNGTATVTFNSAKTLDQAVLISTTGTGWTGDLTWDEAAATLVDNGGGSWTVTASLPEGATAWFVNVLNGDLVASSDYQEIIDLILDPSDQLSISHTLGENQTTGTVQMAFTAPTNVEISDIRLGDQSHPGAFTNLTAAPMVRTNAFPATTPVVIEFDDTIAGLSDGETATAILTIVWDELDGTTDQIQLAIRATADTYAGWIFSYSLIGDDALPGADTLDQDGYDNLAEFALGMNPTNADAGSAESVGTLAESGTNYFQYIHNRRSDHAAQGLTYLLIDRTSLTGVSSPGTNTQDQVSVGGEVDGYEPITNRYITDDPAKFIELKIWQE